MNESVATIYQKWDHDSVFPMLGAPFFAEHLARYRFAQDHALGKEVLELASGKGYGSYLLSEKAKSVLGLDLNDESLQFSRKNYSRENLRFQKGDITQLHHLGQSFDLIIAFEIIEHLQPQQIDSFFKGIIKCLRPGGQLILSTPNHQVVKKSSMPVPEFHINNYAAGDLRRVLKDYFEDVQMLGQILSRGFFLNLVYALDIFHLRHQSLFRKFRQQKLDRVPMTENPPIQNVWRPQQGWGDSQHFIFSKLLWRQAGMTMAICQKSKSL